VSVRLSDRVWKSAYGCGDPTVRLLFLAVADLCGDPKYTDHDGWVRIGTRLMARRIGCDGGKTVNSVIVRAEKEGLQVDRPDLKQRMGYKLPADLLAPPQQMRRRSAGTPPADWGPS
jgi:hypothetical protein